MLGQLCYEGQNSALARRASSYFNQLSHDCFITHCCCLFPLYSLLGFFNQCLLDWCAVQAGQRARAAANIVVLIDPLAHHSLSLPFREAKHAHIASKDNALFVKTAVEVVNSGTTIDDALLLCLMSYDRICMACALQRELLRFHFQAATNGSQAANGAGMASGLTTKAY
eukprot:5638995-Amphidinium_carterae.1